MITPLHQTLEQELNALLRGASLECLACGEFVLRSGKTVSCPECGSRLRAARESVQPASQTDARGLIG